MAGGNPGGRRRIGIRVATLALGVGTALALGPPAPARAQTGPTVVQAEGDASALYAEASLLGQGPIHVGPVSQAVASVPPNATQSAAASLVNCDNAAPPNCVDPLVDSVNVLQSNADAGITGVTTHCDGAPAGFGADHVVGANACVTIASTSVLNTGTPAAPTDLVSASGVTAESQMQGCDDSKALGKVEIANLTVGGQTVVGSGGLDITPSPNTVVPLGLVTVILNEQHYDNSGHGWIVNAVHIFSSADIGSLANVDLVIGHAHAEDMCDTGTVTTPPANPGASGQQLPVGTKADSTKHANPGEVVTYTLSIKTNGCEVSSVTDFLPSGFTYVQGSARGDLGTTPTVTQSSNPAVQTLEWFNATGWTATTLTETLDVKVPGDAAPGDYVNNVEGESSPPAGSGSLVCGSFEFSDTLPTSGPIPANNGSNNGVLVPRPVVAAAPAVATPTPTQQTQAAAAVGTPNTGATPAAGWPSTLGLLALGGTLLAVRRRRRVA